jgi:hypothetical protein
LNTSRVNPKKPFSTALLCLSQTSGRVVDVGQHQSIESRLVLRLVFFREYQRTPE